LLYRLSYLGALDAQPAMLSALADRTSGGSGSAVAIAADQE